MVRRKGIRKYIIRKILFVSILFGEGNLQGYNKLNLKGYYIRNVLDIFVFLEGREWIWV